MPALRQLARRIGHGGRRDSKSPTYYDPEGFNMTADVDDDDGDEYVEYVDDDAGDNQDWNTNDEGSDGGNDVLLVGGGLLAL